MQIGNKKRSLFGLRFLLLAVARRSGDHKVGAGKRDDGSDHFSFLDNDILDWYISKHAAARGFDGLDLVYHFGVLRDFPEYAIAPAILTRKVEEAVVIDVDEKL